MLTFTTDVPPREAIASVSDARTAILYERIDGLITIRVSDEDAARVAARLGAAHCWAGKARPIRRDLVMRAGVALAAQPRR